MNIKVAVERHRTLKIALKIDANKKANHGWENLLYYAESLRPNSFYQCQKFYAKSEKLRKIALIIAKISKIYYSGLKHYKRVVSQMSGNRRGTQEKKRLKISQTYEYRCINCTQIALGKI